MLSVSEISWPRCRSRPAWIYIYWWSGVQPYKKKAPGQKCNRPASYHWSPWPARSEHKNVRCHQPPRRPPSPCHPGPLQHCPTHSIPGHTLQPRCSTRPGWHRGDQVCCCLGQRQGCQGFMHHCRRFFPRCLARENIVSDVDEVLRPARDRRQDAA